MNMKKISMALCLAISAGFAAEGHEVSDVFRQGTHWLSTVCGTQFPEPEVSLIEFSIEGEAEMLGQKCMQLWNRDPADPADKDLATYLRVDGEKVLYIYDSEATDWTLLYDFSLAEGQSCTVTFPDWTWDFGNSPSPTNLILRKTEPYGEGLELMKFTYGSNPGYEDAEYADAYWIRNIGSLGGLMNPMLLDGMGGQLVKVWNGATTYFEDKTLSTPGVDADSARIYVSGRILSVYGEGPVTVARCDGRTVRTGSAPMSMELETPGIYLIATPGNTAKIAVR